LKTKNIIWIALAGVLVLVGLVLIVNSLRKPAAPTATTTPTQDANAVLTGVARTADAKMTEMAAITPSPLPATETLTPFPATATSAPTAMVVPASPTSAGGLPSVDMATFVADVTVPDGSNFSPGQTFVKTWRLKNTGATTWSTSFKLGFLQGDQMGGPASVPVPRAVAPNESVDISVSLIAPSTAGHYRGFWKMINAGGQSFPESVYVDINVVGSGTVTGTPKTPTPSVTPGPTSTTGAFTPTPTTATQTVTISNLTLSVDNANYTGACPHTFVLTGQFNLNVPASVTYQLAAQTTPQIAVGPAQTVQLIAGPAQLVFNLEQNASFSGTIWLHITAPTNVQSNTVNITLTCQ
jgi:hypothetical protein